MLSQLAYYVNFQAASVCTIKPASLLSRILLDVQSNTSCYNSNYRICMASAAAILTMAARDLVKL